MPRCYQCGAEIKFSKDEISPHGVLIPLELYGARHDCPNKPKYNHRKAKATSISEQEKPAAFTRGFQLETIEQITQLKNEIAVIRQDIKQLQDKIVSVGQEEKEKEVQIS
jgi:hypothetical protein